MSRERKRECTVVKCNKKRMWINALLVCICAVALLACASKQSDNGGEGVGTQTTESAEPILETTETVNVENDENSKEMGELDIEGRMLCINGKLYKATSEIGPMGDAGCVGGTIENSVAADATPKEHGQSNFDCVGNPYTFDSGDGAIQVLLEDENYYWFYTDKKIEWKEAAALKITKGDTGEK